MNHVTIQTPAGPLIIMVTQDGAVWAAGFTGDVRELPVPEAVRSRERGDLGAVSKAVRAYFDGELDRLAEVPVRLSAAGAFQTAAWHALQAIPAGVPVTYTQLAAAAGRPAAVRAAANACARNPVALLVPCHRVLLAGGGLGGYRWGTSVKRWLLQHEQSSEESGEAAGEKSGPAAPGAHRPARP